MTELLVGVVCLVSGLAWAELREWLPWIARKVIASAVLVIPAEDRDRMQEELVAELAVVPGKLSPLAFALSIWWGYWRNGVTDPLEAAATRFVVRLSDVVLSSSVLIFAAPVMVLAFLITSVSTGTFGLQRTSCVGRNHALFQYLRFHVRHSQTGQSTRACRFIYRVRLDTLPAFFNVLSGEMSLVGPLPVRTHSSSCCVARLKPGLIWCHLSCDSQPFEKYGVSLSTTVTMYFRQTIEGLREVFFCEPA